MNQSVNEDYTVFLTDEDNNTIEVMPVTHSHWVSMDGQDRFVPLDNNGYPRESCYCMNCGMQLAGSEEYNAIGFFCPNCGSMMDENERPN